MASFTELLRLIKQVDGENPFTWGTIQNNQMTELVEDSIAGQASITLSSGDTILSTSNGGFDQSRVAILNLRGNLAGACRLIAPAVSKIYIIYNGTAATDPAFTVGIKTATGVLLNIPIGEAWVAWCDGIDFRSIRTVPTGTAGAINADTLGGFTADEFARLARYQTFLKGQQVKAVYADNVAGSYVIDARESNTFYLRKAGALNIADPTGLGTAASGKTPLHQNQTSAGQTFNIFIEHVAAGAVTFGGRWVYVGPTAAPALNSAVGKFDIISGSYIATPIDKVFFTVAKGA